MGKNQSKQGIEVLRKQQDILMKQHVEMAKGLAEAQEDSKKQSEVHVEDMAKLMLDVAASLATQRTTKTDEQLIEIEDDVYKITELISTGGFGNVYKAQSKKKKHFVAIKVMLNSPAIEREINNEIRFLRLIREVPLHPHPVIDCYGYKVTSDGIYIVLEMAQCDLYTFWFQEMAKSTPEKRFTYGIIIIMYTLRALTFLERLNIIHGDIKPQNLVIAQNEKLFSVKLIDFGTVEKMNTLRPLMTVDATKPYTQFFVSPEFLKRDSKNLVSRRLHKKSDAWAAGVMFYLLFLEKLPWEDEHDYHNFINDPDARDVMVPAERDYQLIIELLLKKDPEQRASAKETLLQMKGHPVLGVIVAASEGTFYPVDDVCHIEISNSLRDQIANFATPQKRAHATAAEPTTTPPKTRISCRYGSICYRQSPHHREEYAHPDDFDYSEINVEMKYRCRYGPRCFRKNDPNHVAKYSHD